MKLEVGKRYVLRNGEVTNPLRQHDEKLLTDGVERWNVRGYCCFDEEECDHDVVAEYSEPDPSHDVNQPLRWVENCKPDKPGIWAWVVDEGMFEATWISGPSSVSECVIGTWCYLGPIPEILPPLKKVVERLWVYSRDGDDDPVFVGRWIAESETVQPAKDWIRTDRTREREI